MSCCVTIQGKDFVFVGTDTAVSNKVNGEYIRVGYMDKFHSLKNNDGVFISGNTVDVNFVLRYLQSLSHINISEIEQVLRKLKETNALSERIGVLIVQVDKIVAFDWDDDFTPSIGYNPIEDGTINVQAFSNSGEEAKKATMDYLKSQNTWTETELIHAMITGFKSIAKPNVGGELNIRFINKDTFKDIGIVKIDNFPIFPMQEKGTLSINNKFMVDAEGNMTATNGIFSGTVTASNIDNNTFAINPDGTGEIDFQFLTVKNLRVGENVFMSPNAVISYENLPSDVVSEFAMQSYVNTHKTVLPSYITSTKITQTAIESPYITGGTITGSDFWQYEDYDSRGVTLQDGKVILLDSSKKALGGLQTYYDEGKEKVYLVSNPSSPLKIFSGENMSISASGGYKIYQGNTVFTGTIVDKDGKPIGGGSGQLVFG